MGAQYTYDQKNRILLLSDLLGQPLDASAAVAIRAALDESNGDLKSALTSLPAEIATAAEAISKRGFKLALELEKLGQRGVAVVFPDNAWPKRIAALFELEPAVLFVAGRRDLLNEESAGIFVSLDDFLEAGCNGVLVADRPFEALLRDSQIIASLNESRALLISDAFRSRARIKPDFPDDASPRKSDASSPSNKVFISGSRSQREIAPIVQDSLESITAQRLHILIGDSDKGVDNEILDYLRAPLYRSVTVFTIKEQPRVTPEAEWAVKRVDADGSLKPREQQTAKDRAMADEADWGLAVFRPIEKNRHGSLQVSSGTLRNTIQMLLDDKPVRFFYVYEGEVRATGLKTLKDLQDVLDSYLCESLTAAEQAEIGSARGVPHDNDAASVKHRKIIDKYHSLLKRERELRTSPDNASNVVTPAQTMLPLLD